MLKFAFLLFSLFCAVVGGMGIRSDDNEDRVRGMCLLVISILSGILSVVLG